MVNLFSWANPIFLLLTAALVAIHGYRHNSAGDDAAVVGYRYDDDSNLNVKRDPLQNFMWLGPRLGRRKRSEDENNLNEIEKNKGALVELLQESPWAFVALKSGRRRTVNFIPRLGRDSDEEYAENAMDATFGKSSSRSGTQVSGPNFTPRLGRYL